MADITKTIEFIKSQEGMNFEPKFEEGEEIVLCSNCFQDEGLKLDTLKIGLIIDSICPNCSTKDGKKLNRILTLNLAHRFFVGGTLRRVAFGAAPIIQFNHYRYNNSGIDCQDQLKNDMKLIEEAIKVGFFLYGPRMWMLGEVTPLKSLISKTHRENTIKTIIEKYPHRKLSVKETFYRLRKKPQDPSDKSEYDSPPTPGFGRLDSNSISIMYGSQDLEVCVHECRVTIEDELYVATLYPTRELKLLDLTELIEEKDCTEFDSFDLAIQMLFLAGEHSYEITRDMSLLIKEAGFDGIIYPSYFSKVRTGSIPFDTVMGMSVRRFAHLKEYNKSQTIQNIALFGSPIKEGSINVKCINRVVLQKVSYDVLFGPVLSK